MGIIKRIFKQTSHKLLVKLRAQRNTNQFVLNQPIDSTATQFNTKKRKIRRLKKQISSSSVAIPEPLLLASKNFLPPVQFHHVHGPNAQLSKNKYVARRVQSFCQALVFSNRIIMPNERVYIKVLEIAKGWSGTIRFGFTSVDPATLRYQMPKHACPDMTNEGHTWARALADEVVRRNSVIHFSYNSNGYINYGINNQDCGVFYTNVNTSQHLWFIVDVYGLTAAVELIDPRIHNATSSELDLSGVDDELRARNLSDISQIDRSTMFKSTNAMDAFMYNYGQTSSKLKKKRARKLAARQAAAAQALVYGQWHPDNLLMNAPSVFNPQQQGPLLPNLNSLMIPNAQQNIYTPMPLTDRHQNHSSSQANMTALSESHDYYQIMTNGNESHSVRGPPQKVTTATSNVPQLTQNVSLLSAGTSSALNSSTASTIANANTSTGLCCSDDNEICQQLDSLQIRNNNVRNHQYSHQPESGTSIKPTKLTLLPVAATRRRQQQNNFVQTSNFKQRPTPEARSRPDGQTMITSNNNAASSPIKSKTSNSMTGSKIKSRNSIKSQKSTGTGDNNNNSLPSKDCPICFERPINCVLYQCGHMCTCYECGVKQWRTQSRTCPICRTVIKDVIKTYMS